MTLRRATYACLGFLFLFLLLAPGQEKDASRWERFLQVSQLIKDGMDEETKLRCIAAGLIAASDFALNQRDVLKGMEPTVVVEVQVSGDDFKANGPSQDQLKTDVEIRLRKSGIVVVNEAKAATGGFVRACIVAVKSKNDPVYAVSVELEFSAIVLIINRKPGNPTIFGPATLWSRSTVWLLGEQKLQSARQSLQDFVDEFVNDYLAANPVSQPQN